MAIEGLKSFLDKYDIVIDNYNALLPDMDFKKLDERFAESKWLRKYIRCTSVLCKKYQTILSGQYKDHPQGDHHFENERRYTKEELNALITDINDIDFN